MTIQGSLKFHSFKQWKLAQWQEVRQEVSTTDSNRVEGSSPAGGNFLAVFF